MTIAVILRGGGDLASGVVLRLHRVGVRLLVAELQKPLAVRRTVSFAETIYAGQMEIEGVASSKVEGFIQAEEAANQGIIPVMVEPNMDTIAAHHPLVIIDARMTKVDPGTSLTNAPLVIGIGPGFLAGKNCHAVVETLRGHNLGRVFWEGSAAMDTGQPGSIVSYHLDRVLRAPAYGFLEPHAEISQPMKKGDLIATVNGAEIRAGFDGVLRGLIHPSVALVTGMKIGDLDPRNDPSFCNRVSDKALAVGGGVLEALLTKPDIRNQLWK